MFIPCRTLPKISVGCITLLTRGVLNYLTVGLDTGASLIIRRETCLPPNWGEGDVENPRPGMRVLDADGNSIPPRATVNLHL